MTDRTIGDLSIPAAPISPAAAAGMWDRAAPLAVLTREHTLYAAILLVALLLRVVGLGAMPLSPDESAAAWSAWLAAHTVSVAGAPAPVSALYYGVQSLIFWLFGGGDVQARLLPALAGVATVLLPWFWRPWLGRGAALVLAALFAIDPWLTAWSRNAGTPGLSLFLALLTLTALWHWMNGAAHTARRWERTGAVAVAFLITSGPWAWGMAPVLLVFVLIYVLPAQPPALQRTTAFWFGGALALAITGFALRPEAPSAVGASLTAWIGEIVGAAHTNPLGWPWQRLLLDQPLLAVLGPIGLLWLWLVAGRSGQQARQLALFVTAWLVWGALLLLLPGRPAAALTMIGLPLAIAAAVLIGRVAAAQPWLEYTGLELFTLLVVQGVLVVTATIWLAASVDNVVFNNQLWVTSAVILALMLAVWVVFGFWAGWRATGQIALLFYAVLFAALTLRSSWHLNHNAELMEPDGFWPATTSPDVRLLVEDVERLSALRRGDPTQADMQVVHDVAPDPVLGWALRNMRNLRHLGAADVNSIQQQIAAGAPNAALPLIVAPTSRNDTLELPDPYIGSRFHTKIRWQPAQLPPPVVAEVDEAARAQAQWTTYWRSRLQWLFYRKIFDAPPVETVTLWAPR